MYVECLELVGCTRLTLNNIERIVITPENVSQILLGSNGSGKSSVLEEWSPLPASPSDYIKGGMKRCTFNHNHFRYIATSDFTTSTGKHSLLKIDENGKEVELNEGGTITVQRELCERLFNLTTERMHLLLGKEEKRALFTMMSPTQERRPLITQMSQDNLDYAMKEYTKAATAARDCATLIKHNRTRLAKETDRLLLLNVDSGLEEEVATLEAELTLLMDERTSTKTRSSEVEHQLVYIKDEIDKTTQSILTHRFAERNVEGFADVDSIKSVISDKKADLNFTVNRLATLNEEYVSRKELLDAIVNSEEYNVDELKVRLEVVQNDTTEKLSQIRQFTFTGDVSSMAASASMFKGLVANALADLPDNSDRQYSRTVLAAKDKERDEVSTALSKNQFLLRKLDEQVTHIEAAHDTRCPKCDYVWKEGVKEGELESLRKERVTLVENIIYLKSKLEDVVNIIEKIHEYSNAMRRLKSIFHEYPLSSNLLNYLLEDNRVMDNPMQHTPVLDIWMHDLFIADDLYKNSKEITWLQDAFSASQITNVDSKDAIQTSVMKLEADIDHLTYRHRSLQDQIGRYTDLLQLGHDLTNKDNLLTELVNRRDSLLTLYVESLRNEKIGEIIAMYQNMVAVKTSKLNEKKIIEGVIGELEMDLQELEKKHLANKHLATALSPVDGIIAKQMLQFITVMVDQVNEVIASIWTYPLVVLPCGTEKGGLDYKFPMKVGHNEKLVADVSDGSKGQREIINFAFRLVMIMYLSYDEYPLYMDEVGQMFDEVHTTNLMNYVKMLMEAHRHTQLVMVSHAATFYGAFSNADFCVLSSTNIAIPHKHNDHVIIT
jgi:recombinational DNA repair ATPase RecF